MRRIILSLIILGFSMGEKIKFIEKPESVKITVIKKKEVDYLLLKREKPLTFEAEGPVFLRIYTRLIFDREVRDTAYYKIILQEDEERERVITKKTVPSEVAKTDNLKVGKWRTFLVEVPPGKHLYKLILWDSPFGNVGVRVKETSPPQWIDLTPLNPDETVTAVEEEKIITYYIKGGENPLNLRVEGPSKLKVLVRMNFTEEMGNEGNFTLSVSLDGEEILRNPVRTYRSQTVFWRERKDLVPSKAEQFYIDVPKGTHTVSVRVLGTLAPSSAFRILKLKRIPK
jgi:hypothetical protein